MEKEFTYEVSIPPKTETRLPSDCIIGWRKTAEEAGEFAGDLLTFPTGNIHVGKPFMYDSVLITRRERKEGDFDY